MDDFAKRMNDEVLATLYPGTDPQMKMEDDPAMFGVRATVQVPFLEEGKQPEDGIAIMILNIPFGTTSATKADWQKLLGRMAAIAGEQQGKTYRPASTDELIRFYEAEEKKQQEEFFKHLLEQMPTKEQADA